VTVRRWCVRGATGTPHGGVRHWPTASSPVLAALPTVALTGTQCLE